MAVVFNALRHYCGKVRALEWHLLHFFSQQKSRRQDTMRGFVHRFGGRAQQAGLRMALRQGFEKEPSCAGQIECEGLPGMTENDERSGRLDSARCAHAEGIHG